MCTFTFSSIKEVRAFAASTFPGGDKIFKRADVATYEDFVEVLYEDIDDIIRLLEQNRELQNGLPEDVTTIQLVTNLRSRGYEAHHDLKINGHTDISVTRGTYLWIGEAKKHNSTDYVYEGFLQLTTRYSTGVPDQNAGGLLIYLHTQPNTVGVMENWRNHLAGKGLPNYTAAKCPKSVFAIRSSHTHETTGLDFYVRHIPLSLYFAPMDKSGVKTRARAKAAKAAKPAAKAAKAAKPAAKAEVAAKPAAKPAKASA